MKINCKLTCRSYSVERHRFILPLRSDLIHLYGGVEGGGRGKRRVRVKGGGGEGWGRTPLGDGPYPHSRAPGRHKQNRILYYSIFLSHIKKEKKEISLEIKSFHPSI